MSINKSTVSVALIGLFAASVATALPGFSSDAPKASVDTCLEQVNAHADFNGAGSVQHTVETEDRRVSGHKMSIDTIVYQAESENVLRRYKAFCAIDDNADIQRFKIRQKSS